MKHYDIAVIEGDGIGPEVTEAAIRVMEKVAESEGAELNFHKCLAGGAAIDDCGLPLPKTTLDTCKHSDAVLLGAVGGPKWDKVRPELRPEKALLGLRKELGLFANLRPALLWEPLADACPLKNVSSIDILIVRELTGGIYFGDRGRTKDGAYDTEEYTDEEIRRIIREGFRYADGRGKKLTVVDKANVLETSRLWREITEQERLSYPDIEVEYLYVDNASMQLISRPQSFDVIVTSNMFGDILSDEAGEITGSIGMLPSASLGLPGRPGMYEPIHGSAPDIAGTDTANPLAAILSGAMMFKWSFGMDDACGKIEKAVLKVLEAGIRTKDIAGDNETYVGTKEMTEEVLKRL